jgi:hypothetical protein
MDRMNQRVKKLWLEALEGGEFKHFNHLCYKGGPRRWDCVTNGFYHTSFAVLCELYHRNTGRGWWNEKGWFFGPRHIESEYSWLGEFQQLDCGPLPPSVMNWAGIPRHKDWNNDSCMKLNWQVTFPRIFGAPMKFNHIINIDYEYGYKTVARIIRQQF